MASHTRDSTRPRRLLRVLYLEDTPLDAKLSSRQLEQAGFELSTDLVTTREQFRDALRSKPYDVVLAGYRLPGWSGLEALEVLQREGAEIPFILVTGTLGEETAVECIKKGATDYVLKDRLARLPFAVERALKDKRAREERKGAETLLYLRTQALWAAANAVLITDCNGEIIWVNEAFSALTGYAANDVLGKNPRILKSGKHDAELYQNLWATILAGKVWHGEVVNRRRDGSFYVEETTITPVRDEHGEITHFIDIKQDITDRLERRRLGEQLRQAQKMEAIGRLAGGIAHDFNNLLTIIIGHCAFGLECAAKDTPLAGHFEEIKNAGERAAALTRQLLAFSRSQVLQPRILDLNQSIADLEKMLRRIIGEHIELTLSPARDLGLVKADPSQVEQIIMNLVLNARDAMPQGGKFIIETANAVFDQISSPDKAGVSPGAYVMLKASDTGCGMDEDTQARIFEPFFTTKEQGKGTGLGLSTVYGIVKQSGGAITVESEPGKGSRFTIYLPQAIGVPETVRWGLAQPREPKGSGVVLSVEDESALRALVRCMLEAGGYTVLEAADVNEALNLGATYGAPIDLLLTDMVMPGMSGKKLAEHLLRLRKETKVLYMSGYTDEIIAQGDPEQTPTAFIQKPFTSEALLSAMRQALSRPQRSERRRHSRVDGCGAEVHLHFRNRAILAVSANLSEGGMLLQSRDLMSPIPLSETLRLQLKTPTSQHAFEPLARVVRIEPSSQTGRVAVEFTNLSDADRSALRTLIAAQQESS